MNQRQKKIENAIKTLSYRDIKKEHVFGDQKKSGTKPETGAKLLLRSSPLRMLRKRVYFKKALALTTIIAVIITAYFQNTPQAPLETIDSPLFLKFLTG